MKVSLNTIKQYLDFDLPPVDELVASINAQLGGVDEVIDLSLKYKGIVIVRVVTCEKHPNADMLSVCMIDDGGVANGVDRDENGYVQVVCGAPNVRAGLFAAWLPPQSTVPTSYGTKEPFVLDVRDLRGIKSNGMLAAADELDLGTDHAGIIEIDPTEWKPSNIDIKPGARFAEVYGLDDVIIDIENKMFTHRPDCFGQIGVAREIAGILNKPFASPDWYAQDPQFTEASGLELTVVNEASEKVPRFMAVALKDVTVKPSPLWLRIELVRLGSKAINNIVDVTNYVMLLTGQPTHAYDYGKLRGRKLGARMAEAGEKTTLLNGKTYELTEDDIVIVDGEGIVGLGGVMGGGNSEVSDETKNVVLECANFDMYTVRKTSMRHGLFTDAVTRFSKGQSSLQQPYAINLLMQSTFDVAGGAQASVVFDESAKHESAEKVMVTPTFIIERLGVRIKNDTIKQLLGNVEFTIDEHELTSTESFASQLGDMGEVRERQFSEIALYMTPPFWRTDIELPEDVVEEVGRLYGFDKLPRELPRRSILPAQKNHRSEMKRLIRESLSRSGANEVLTYSFVHERLLKHANQDISQAFRVSNALSPDLQYYRLSVLPSLLDKVHTNIKAGHDEFVLFEIGKAHNKKNHFDDNEGLPRELEMVDGIYANKVSQPDAAYYYVRTLVSRLGFDLGLSLHYKTIEKPLDDPLTAPFETTRSALVETAEGVFVGIVGELKQPTRTGFKLPDHSAAFSLDIDGILSAQRVMRYKPLSRFPRVAQDISLRVAHDVSYASMYQSVQESLDDTNDTSLSYRVSPISIYQPEQDHTHKIMTFRIFFTSEDRTLTDRDVSPLIDHVAEVAWQQCGAERA